MGFWIALQFLTIIPMPFKKEPKEREIASSLVFFPIVALLIGLLLFLANWGLGEVFSPVVTAAFTLLVWILISGAMHLDGLADSCDGLAGNTAEKRLEIMKDSHIGAFGVVGISLLLLVKFAAIVSLSGWEWEALVLAPVFGTWAMVLAITVFPYARKNGVGQAFKQGATIFKLLIATIITLAAAALLAGWWGVVIMAITCLVTVLVGVFFKSRLGGLTGDTYGAIKEVSEAIVLILTPVLLSIGF
ncbi:MAG: adenosylcobinamide-GDP ribazoletransferase [Dehalococcoidales bacterium]|nr:adenosylcobinamide-GDP ribazoletransferase [Dehalococcoidales bacterium]